MTTTTKQKTVLTRRNKNYTSIFITDFSDETLQEAIDIDANEQYSVIKLKKSAVEDYIRRLTLSKKLIQRDIKKLVINLKLQVAILLGLKIWTVVISPYVMKQHTLTVVLAITAHLVKETY